MCNGKFPLKIIVFVSLSTLLNQQLAFGIETLPDVIVLAPEKLIQEQINTSEVLTEEDITIGHERSISDVLTGLSGISQSRIGGFGQPGSLYVRGVDGQGLMTLDGIPLIQAVPGFWILIPCHLKP